MFVSNNTKIFKYKFVEPSTALEYSSLEIINTVRCIVIQTWWRTKIFEIELPSS